MQVASPLEFYDIWVARDLDGQQFLKGSPYVTDPYSLQRIRAGLPFRVKCCWNGLVVMRAAPFVQQNLRMRYGLRVSKIMGLEEAHRSEWDFSNRGLGLSFTKGPTSADTGYSAELSTAWYANDGDCD